MKWIVAPIVEGHGEETALPVLLRLLNPSVEVKRPVRVPKSKIVKPAETEHYVRIARANIDDPRFGLILLVVDADEDCPGQLGPRLLSQMQPNANGAACFVAVAQREYESWLLAGLDDFQHLDPHAAGNAKSRLGSINNERYRETVDQVRFTSRIDVTRACRSVSFRRLYNRMQQLSSGSMQ